MTTFTPSFGAVRERVEAQLEAGEPFADAEATIDASRLPEDERAALWLVAWSLNECRDELRWPREIPLGRD